MLDSSNTFVNPNRGIIEEQPFQLAARHDNGEVHTRNFYTSSTDWFGNVMDDPDRNNPTRPKHERPLDTIRSFELAISKDYHVDAADGMSSRRNSTYSAYHPSVVAGGRESQQQQYQQGQPHQGYSRDSMYTTTPTPGHVTPGAHPRERNGSAMGGGYFNSSQSPVPNGAPAGYHRRPSGYRNGSIDVQSPQQYSAERVEFGNGNYAAQSQQPVSPPSTPPRKLLYKFTGVETPEDQVGAGGPLTPPDSADKGDKKSKWRRFSRQGKKQ